MYARVRERGVGGKEKGEGIEMGREGKGRERGGEEGGEGGGGRQEIISLRAGNQPKRHTLPWTK